MRARGGTRARREDAVALTPRQEEVLRLLERGYTNAEVAEALGISPDGAKFHVGEIIGKLGVSTREEAVAAWRGQRRRRVPLVALGALRWVGAAAAVIAVVSVSAVLIALAVGDDGDDAAIPDAAVTTAPPGVSQTVGPTPAAMMVGCPERAPLQPSGGAALIDWIDFVRFEGISYAGHGFAPEATIPTSEIGQSYGEVEFQLFNHVQEPGYQVRDCDSSYLPVGTVLYTIKGYDPRFRLAMPDGKIYQAYSGEGVSTAGDITDLRGKVTAIEFRGGLNGDATVVGRVTEPSEITRLVELFLAAEFDDARVPTPQEYDLPRVEVAFVLRDAPEFARTYQPDIGRVWPGIWLPAEFNEAAKAAMGQ
ncbi:MAG TPA: helix-turn-helix transcriptional regulator [Tepidiformaceae bacterium]|nr:helix-turn-helix transcriptional regulator [Tepidiformaceae bacterium]